MYNNNNNIEKTLEASFPSHFLKPRSELMKKKGEMKEQEGIKKKKEKEKKKKKTHINCGVSYEADDDDDDDREK